MDPNASTDSTLSSDHPAEGMWQLGLGETTSYPERPGEPDCFYYLRTGFCGYAHRCRFNHPPHPSPFPVTGGRVGRGDYPERSGQPICQYYMRTGSCKFGSSCKYHHLRQEAGSVSPLAVNVYGHPTRPGEKECSYYMKTGQCKFGVTCKFHHPHPSDVTVATGTPATVPPPVAASATYPAPTAQPYWPLAKQSMMAQPYRPMLLSPGVVPVPSWAPYPTLNRVPTANVPLNCGLGQVYGLTELSPSAPAYSGAYQVLSSSTGTSCSIPKESSFPQRPRQPECQYYLNTGGCKFGSSCKYHHPAEWVVPESSSTLSPMGLPLRPGNPTCSYYAQHRVCKFGPACKFDHPMGTLSHSPTSSLSDIQVASYPVGTLTGTLALSQSSSDLPAGTIAWSNKDSATPLSSSLSITSDSGGSVSSRTGSMCQQPSQIAPTSGNSTGNTSDAGA